MVRYVVAGLVAGLTLGAVWTDIRAQEERCPDRGIVQKGEETIPAGQPKIECPGSGKTVEWTCKEFGIVVPARAECQPAGSSPGFQCKPKELLSRLKCGQRCGSVKPECIADQNCNIVGKIQDFDVEQCPPPPEKKEKKE